MISSLGILTTHLKEKEVHEERRKVPNLGGILQNMCLSHP